MIEDLKITLIPKEEENLRLHRQRKDIIDDIEKEKNQRESLSIKVKQHELKLNSKKKEYESSVSEWKVKEDELRELESKIAEAFEMKDDMHQLKRSLISLSNEYIDNNILSSCKKQSGDNVARECESLRRQVETIQQVINRNIKKHDSNMKKAIRENKILTEVSSILLACTLLHV